MQTAPELHSMMELDAEERLVFAHASIQANFERNSLKPMLLPSEVTVTDI